MTKEALEKSIRIWQIRAGGTAKQILNDDLHDEPCPLCALYADSYNSCLGCPVSEKTGQGDCRGTPFYSTIHAYNNVFDAEGEAEYTAAMEDYRKYAKEMLDFLKGLRHE